MSSLSALPSHLILYDGHCALCHWSVRRVLKADEQSRFYFVALQTETGQLVLEAFQKPTDRFDTLYYLDASRSLYQKSTAVLKIAEQLPAYRGWAILAKALPLGLRDFLYDAISRNRKRGPAPDRCPLLSPAQQARILS